MAWGFLDWVRGRPYRPDPGKLTLRARPTDTELRSMALYLLDDAKSYDASKLLGGHRERAQPILEQLLRDDSRFRSLTDKADDWSRTRFESVLKVLIEWGSTYAVEEAVALAASPDPRLRAISARLVAATGQKRFAGVLTVLADDPVAEVRTALARGISDALEYEDSPGTAFDDALALALYDLMRDCALRGDRGPGNNFAGVLLRVDPACARRDFDPEVALTIDRNWLRDLIEALRGAGITIPPARVESLLREAVAVFDRDDFAVRDHPSRARLVAELLCLLAEREPAKADRWMRTLRAHKQAEARDAAQQARERLSLDPVKVVLGAHEAAGGLERMRAEHRGVYLAWLMEAEVSNGGWLQWIANSSGAAIRETEAALREVGAGSAAEEVVKVMEALGPEGSSPEQQRRMDAIDRMLKAGRSLPADGVIWKMSTELRALLYDYAERHRDAFPRA